MDKRPAMTAHGANSSAACNGDDAKGASSGGHSGQATSSSRPSDDKTGKYKLLGTLGKGNFAKVKLAVHTLTNEKVSAYLKC